MKILLISTYKNSGGAAIACYRIFKALKSSGADVKMLVLAGDEEQDIRAVSNTAFKRKRQFLNFVLERLYFLFYEKSKQVRFAFTPANIGFDISNHPWVQEADVINLHWTHHGFISLKGYKKLLSLKKRIFFTLHDMWLFTGGCHYSATCEAYKTSCGNCPFLAHPSQNDLSKRIFDKKNRIFAQNEFQIITPSKWLKNEALKSTLLKDRKVNNIFYPIDLDIFKPKEQITVRKDLGLPQDKKLLLFVADKIDDERKGYKYLKKAIDCLVLEEPALSKSVEILLLGNIKDENEIIFNLPTHKLGRITGQSKIAAIFSAADVFLAPSLEDNLPNTILEALACGLPVVAFDTGGIPEMVTHRFNGFIAPQRDFKALKYGITWILDMKSDEYQKIRKNARQQALNFSPEVIAKSYLEAFEN